MNRKSLLAALTAAVMLPAIALAALKPGSPAPTFKLEASLAGKPFTFSLQDALKKGPVVVYFYPSAYTQGCNVQAHTFAENIDQFHAAGATVIGVSLDSIQRLNEFSADPDYCAGKLPVASDVDGKIARSYGLEIKDGFMNMKAKTMKDSRGQEIGHDFAERVTFIVTPDGKISQTIGDMKPQDNVMAALAAVKEMKGKAGK